MQHKGLYTTVNTNKDRDRLDAYDKLGKTAQTLAAIKKYKP